MAGSTPTCQWPSRSDVFTGKAGWGFTLAYARRRWLAGSSDSASEDTELRDRSDGVGSGVGKDANADEGMKTASSDICEVPGGSEGAASERSLPLPKLVADVRLLTGSTNRAPASKLSC